MNKRKYIAPMIIFEEQEIDELLFNNSVVSTTSYTEDPSEDDNGFIHIHPDPIDPPGPIDDDDDE